MKVLIYDAKTETQKFVNVPDEDIQDIPVNLSPTLEERIERLEEIVSL